MTIVPGYKIPFYIFEPEKVFALLDARPNYEHDAEGKKTDRVDSYSYSVANIDSFEKYRIKVLRSKPIILPDELKRRRNAGEKFWVEFEELYLKMYFSSFTNCYEDSITAENILFVDMEE